MVAAIALGIAGCASGPFGGTTFDPYVYEVRPGDTLYSIAWRYQLDPKALARWNDVDEPEQLQVGRKLRLRPPEQGTTASPGEAEAAGDATVSVEQPAEDGDKTRREARRRSDRSTSEADAGAGDWRWPTSGRVVGTFDDGRVAGSGLDIAGEVGQAVKATRAGEVVYSGSGLKAYGRLVIIRHRGDFLSAYAHNDELLVREGERVTAGQQIARMGENRDGAAMLHFEIRDGGQPVDPLQYLPARD